MEHDYWAQANLLEMSGEPGGEPEPKAKAAASAKAAAPKATAQPSVPKATAEVRRAAGPSRRAVRTVTGVLPPAASSTGRRYYLFVQGEHAPLVVAGQAATLELLGGSWLGHSAGRSPEGFADLESALNAAAERGHRDVKVRLF